MWWCNGTVKIKRWIKNWLILGILSVASTIASADNCYFYFGNPIQTYSNTAGIQFACNAKVYNDTNNILPAALITNPTGSCSATCGGGNCIASGIPAAVANAGSFVSGNSSTDVTVSSSKTVTLGSDNTVAFRTVTVKSGGTLVFAEQNANYYIKTLSVESGGKLTLVGGNFWIEQLNVQTNATVTLKNSNLVKVYVNSNATVEDNVSINSDSGSKKADNLFVYGYGDLNLGKNVVLTGFMYAQGKITLNSNAKVTGAILAASVQLQDNAVVTYDATAAAKLDTSALCPKQQNMPDHFEITHEGNAIYCAMHIVKVAAKNKKDLVTGYTGTIILNTGTGSGSWSILRANGTFAKLNTNNGFATYKFDPSDNGMATFSLDYNIGAAVVNLQVYDENNPSIQQDNSTDTLKFSSIGFVFTSSNISAAPDFNGNYLNYAYKNAQVAGVSSDIYMTAFGQIDDNSCDVIRDYKGDKTIKFWQDYIDPNSGKIVATINDIAIGGSEHAASDQKVTFTAGTAKVGMRYRDVGKIMLYAKDDKTVYNIKSANMHGTAKLRGSTYSFVVKPAKFAIQVTNNPAASDANGSIFAKAGGKFQVQVTVQDNDGNTTPNYGNENNAAGINIFSSTLVSPNGGYNGSNNDGVIINGNNFSKSSAGKFIGNNFGFDEVGIIKLTAEVDGKDYLGAGNVSGPESGNIGRFVPDGFLVSANVPTFDTGCKTGSFSYIGQGFKYNIAPVINITAIAANDTVTRNYTGSYFKLAKNYIANSYSSNSATTLNSAAAEIDFKLKDNADGTATLSLGDGGGLSYIKLNNSQIAPFNAEIALATKIIDADGVAYDSNPFIIGGTGSGEGIGFSAGNKFYQGRMELSNNYGSELMNLNMPMYVEYFNGTAYETNAADSCTSFNNATFLTITPNDKEISTKASVTTFNKGVGKITLSPPSPSGKTGYFNIEANLTSSGANLQYLQHNWNYDGKSNGTFMYNPQAQGTFGIYGGNSNIIYMREVTD